MEQNDYLSSFFADFAGREVPLVVANKPFEGTHALYDNHVMVLKDPNDPTVKEIEARAKDCDMQLRVWFPGSRSEIEEDIRDDRINAYVAKAADGKWRLGTRFNIG